MRLSENLASPETWEEHDGGTGNYLWIEGNTLRLGPDYGGDERDIFPWSNAYKGVIPVNAGDRVVFQMNVRLDPSGSGDGAFCGYDYYNASMQGIKDPNSPWFFGENSGKIGWGKSGVLKIDKTVPAFLNGVEVKFIVPWAMAQPFQEPAFVYFTDPQLHINPAACSCTEWVNAECVSNTQRRQTRSCSPVGCGVEERVADDASCAPVVPPPPVYKGMWVASECGLDQVSIDKLRKIGHVFLPEWLIETYHGEGEDFAVFLKTHPMTKQFVKDCLAKLLSVWG